MNDTVKAILGIVGLIVLGVVVFFLARTFKSKCPSGEIWDKEHERCRPICTDDQYYDWTRDACVYCPEGEEWWKGKKCVRKCPDGQDRCDDGNCYDGEMTVCRPLKDKDGDMVVCTKMQVCTVKDADPDGKDTYSDVCCAPTDYCKGDKCVPCEESGDDMVFCGDQCCQKEHCTDAGGVQKCCTITGQINCDGECCDPEQCGYVAEKGKNVCCAEGTVYDPSSSKCMKKCGSVMCDPETQVCMKYDGKDYCKNIECNWDTNVQYDPSLFDGVRVCSNKNNNTFWASHNPGKLSLSIRDEGGGQGKCDQANCYEKAIEKGLEQLDWNHERHECSGTVNCQQLPEAKDLPTKYTGVDFNAPKWCKNNDGDLTGQVCAGDNEACYDGKDCRSANKWYISSVPPIDIDTQPYVWPKDKGGGGVSDIPWCRNVVCSPASTDLDPKVKTWPTEKDCLYTARKNSHFCIDFNKETGECTKCGGINDGSLKCFNLENGVCKTNACGNCPCQDRKGRV